MFKDINYDEVFNAFMETFLMSFVTSIFVLILGLLLGYALYKAEEKKLFTYKIINILSSVARSIPFIILIILLLPVTNV